MIRKTLIQFDVNHAIVYRMATLVSVLVFCSLCCVSIAHPVKLTRYQITSIQRKRSRIQELEANPDQVQDAGKKREVIVELTPEQQKTIVENHPGLFQQKAPNKRDDVSPLRRTSRQTGPGLQKCPPEQSWAPLTLAINLAGQLIQPIQFSGASQWILDEQCQQQNDHVGYSPYTVYQVDCNTTWREIYVLAIDFSTWAIEWEQMHIACCVTFY